MDLTVTGDLTVKGESDLDGMLTCRSNSFFTGFLRVGALAGVGFNVLEIAQINQDLTVGGDSTLTGNLVVNGANGVMVEGPVVVNDILRTNTPHGIVCGGELQVAQDATLQETLTVQGDVTAEADVTVQGQLNFSQTDFDSAGIFQVLSIPNNLRTWTVEIPSFAAGSNATDGPGVSIITGSTPTNLNSTTDTSRFSIDPNQATSLRVLKPGTYDISVSLTVTSPTTQNVFGLLSTGGGIIDGQGALVTANQYSMLHFTARREVVNAPQDIVPMISAQTAGSVALKGFRMVMRYVAERA